MYVTWLNHKKQWDFRQLLNSKTDASLFPKLELFWHIFLNLYLTQPNSTRGLRRPTEDAWRMYTGYVIYRNNLEQQWNISEEFD